jgi:hypothetical protein
MMCVVNVVDHCVVFVCNYTDFKISSSSRSNECI